MVSVRGPDHSVVHQDGCANAGLKLAVSMGGEGSSPGDIAVAIRVEGIAAFGKDPFCSVEDLSQSEVIAGNVSFRFGEAFFGDGELVHESEAEFVLFGGEIHGQEAVVKVLFGFPADFRTQPGAIASTFHRWEFLHEQEEDRFDKVPIVGANGEESAKRELVAVGFVDVEDAEVAFPAGSDVETQSGIFDFRILIFD